MQTISTTRLLRQRPRPATRCKGSQVEQALPCTTGVLTNGFLRHQFLPKYEVSNELPKREIVEAVYFKSLKGLKSFYNLQTMDVSQHQYPYNILLSKWDASRKMRVKGRFRELLIEEKEDNGITVSVKETLNTGYDLYYIPLASLYKRLENGADE